MTYVSSGDGHRPLVIAHRGASAARPENTIAAFRHAAGLGADWVELDVRRTADGALVVHHDAVLPDGRVIVDLDVGDLPASVPSLAAALDACTGMGVNIEIKNSRGEPDFDPDDRVAAAVVDVVTSRIEQSGSDRAEPDLILVTSFNWRTIGAVRAAAASVPTGQLVIDLADPVLVVDRAVAAGHVAVNPPAPLVDRAFMDLSHGAGLLVFPWTVDDPDQMRALLDLGVDGIITNVPDIARAVVDGPP